MARNVAPLGVAELGKFRTEGRHAVGNRVYLEIARSGRRSWLLRYPLPGQQPKRGKRLKENWLTIGEVDVLRLGVSLQNARTQAAELLAAVDRGENPAKLHKVQAARPDGAVGRRTFGEAVKSFLEANDGTWTNAKHADQWRGTLEHYGKPIWNRAVAAVTVQDVAACFRLDWRRVPVTVDRTLARFRAVFDHAEGQGWRENNNPARLGPVKQALGQRPPREERNHAAMRWQDLPKFYERLEAVEGPDRVTADALRFLILTAARTQEARDLPWTELDLKKNVWTCPGPRMKRRRAHRVPLSGEALKLLASRPRQDREPMVFADITRSGMYELLATLGVNKGEATTHGFRSAFTDWCVDNRVCDSQLADIAIAHRVRNKTRRAYERTDRLEERRPVMERWAQFLSNDPRQFG
jgi:integrase